MYRKRPLRVVAVTPRRKDTKRPSAKPQHSWGVRLYRRVEGLVAAGEKNAILRLIVALLFLIPLWQIINEYSSREEDRINNAWQVLLTRASGNAGRVEALETLFDAGVELINIDLSCRSLDGLDSKGECVRPAWLVKLDLSRRVKYLHWSKAELEKIRWIPVRAIPDFVFDPGARLLSVDFSDAVLAGADLREATITNSKLTDTILQDVTFAGATVFKTDFAAALADGSDWRDADVKFSSFADTSMRNSQLEIGIFDQNKYNILHGIDITESKLSTGSLYYHESIYFDDTTFDLFEGAVVVDPDPMIPNYIYQIRPDVPTMYFGSYVDDADNIRETAAGTCRKDDKRCRPFWFSACLRDDNEETGSCSCVVTNLHVLTAEERRSRDLRQGPLTATPIGGRLLQTTIVD